MENSTSKKVTFVQYAQPQLEDGNYEIEVIQTVSSASGIIPEKPYSATKRFTVLGERFSINPDDVVSVFPPEFSLGEFSNVLPHVVLKRTTMPWERSPGEDATTNDAPWLGLLLFNEGDSPPVPVPNDPSKTKDVSVATEMTLLNLLPTDEQTQDGTPGLLPAGTYFPPFPVRQGKTWRELDYGEAWTDKCMALDVPKEIFNNIAPTIDDLGWLAHVKEVNITNKTETYIRKLRANSDDKNTTTKIAEVIGNRFALPGKKCTVHLVCLENFGPALPGAGGVSHLPDSIDTVRIVSLRSWTYSAIAEQYTFAGLLMAINNAAGGNPLNTLQVPFKSSGNATGDAAVSNALNMGYAAFNHTTRLGDKTVSWYHGPFVPFDVKENVPFPGNAADEFTRYNPDSAMFDTSYSSAWQLGRLLGLQSNSFATTLYNWKRGLSLEAIRKAEQEFLNLSYKAAADLLKETLSNYVNPFNAPVTAELGRPSIKAVSMNKAGRLQAVRQAMADPEKIKSLVVKDTTDVPYAISSFVAKLKLLYGMPFNYLVPDERMLPLESLRFFYMDSAWVDTLIEGAMSIGSSTAADANIQKAITPLVHSKGNNGAATTRKLLFTSSTALADAPITPIANPTGFILRSQVVTGWPGFEAHGFDKDGKELDLLRFEQLSASVVICIFNGVVQTVKLQEHPEALHFGVDMDINDPSPDKFVKSLRFITAYTDPTPPSKTYQPGEQVPDDIVKPLVIKPYYRPSSSVLQVSKLATDIPTAMQKIYSGNFTSAEFGLEMIEGVQQVTFKYPAS